jgi:hypothetical protein
MKMLYQEMEAIMKGEPSQYYQMAKDNGMFSGTLVAGEMHLIEKMAKKRILNARALAQKSGKYKALGYFAEEKVWGMMEHMSDFYGNMEGFFKTVRMRDHIETWLREKTIEQYGPNYKKLGQKELTLKDFSAEEQGAVITKAAEVADHALFNYTSVPKWLRVARNYPFIGSPFLTFTYKAAGATMEALARRPQKFIKYALFPYLMSHATMLLNDMDEEDYEQLLRDTPRWQQEKGSIYILPWKDANNKWVPMDVGYVLPYGPFINALTFAGKGIPWEDDPIQGAMDMSGKLAFDTFGFLGGPLPAITSAVLTNTDPFTGRDIAPEGASGGEKLAHQMKYAHNMWLPSFISPQGALGNVLDTLGIGMYGTPPRQLTEAGTPRMTTGQAAARFAGVNVYPFAQEESRRTNVKSFLREIRKIQTDARYKLKNRNIPPQEKAAINREARARVKHVRERMRKFREGS